MASPLGVNGLLRNKWRLQEKIGQGAFGEIYVAEERSTGERVAVKLERQAGKKQVMNLEVTILRRLQGSPYACHFYACGQSKGCTFLVMQLLGPNLSELRRSRPLGKFSVFTTSLLGLQAVSAIEALHSAGYVHRDIKPSNFAISLERDILTGRHGLKLIDFGLARKFVDVPDGAVRPARAAAGFRGTARYASINSHLGRELGRRDDLWSLLYMLLEFLQGNLPWRKESRERIGQIKEAMHADLIPSTVPSQMAMFMRHIDTLSFECSPSYVFLRQQLWHMLIETGCSHHELYDWEQPVPTHNMERTISRPGEEDFACDADGDTESAILDPIVSNIFFGDQVSGEFIASPFCATPAEVSEEAQANSSWTLGSNMYQGSSPSDHISPRDMSGTAHPYESSMNAANSILPPISHVTAGLPGGGGQGWTAPFSAYAGAPPLFAGPGHMPYQRLSPLPSLRPMSQDTLHQNWRPGTIRVTAQRSAEEGQTSSWVAQGDIGRARTKSESAVSYLRKSPSDAQARTRSPSVRTTSTGFAAHEAAGALLGVHYKRAKLVSYMDNANGNAPQGPMSLKDGGNLPSEADVIFSN